MISKNQIKYIKDLDRKGHRQAEGLFVVEGEKLVAELLETDIKIHSIFALTSWLEKNPSVDAEEISSKDLGRISQLKTPNQVLAVAHMPEQKTDLGTGLTLFLDRINDPGNLGTIIRMADWFGVKQIVCSQGSVDVYNSKVVQSSMGSVYRMPVMYADSQSFFESYKNDFPSHEIVGAAMNGEPLQESGIASPMVLVMGSESHGIDPNIELCLTKQITIPRVGEAESLNVGVATGIILWELNRG